MTNNPNTPIARPGRFARIIDSDLMYSFLSSKLTVVSAIVTLIFFGSAIFAPLVAPHHPFDPATIDLLDAFTPPIWVEYGDARFLLGTDDQGRDILSTIIYGCRISLLVGFAAVGLSMLIGVTVGLLSGFYGGWIDTVFMRLADVQLTVPAILTAIVIDGVAELFVPVSMRDTLSVLVLILAIGLSDWPRYARVARSSTMVERNKEYVMAARVIGVGPVRIMFKHVLPNITGPLLVMATIGLAIAITTEATLSFLGVGVPPTTPSLGTLIRIGNSFLFSGEWWITIFPSLALVLLVLSVNLLSDWLRDALNPKLR
jgi:peptide/nickel transport system permease protein